MKQLEKNLVIFLEPPLARAPRPRSPRSAAHHAKISSNGHWVYVGLFGTNRIAVIDTKTHEVVEYLSGEGGGALQAQRRGHHTTAASCSCPTRFATWSP